MIMLSVIDWISFIKKGGTVHGSWLHFTCYIWKIIAEVGTYMPIWISWLLPVQCMNIWDLQEPWTIWFYMRVKITIVLLWFFRRFHIWILLKSRRRIIFSTTKRPVSSCIPSSMFHRSWEEGSLMLIYIMAAYLYNEFEHLETNNWMHNLYTTKFYTLATSHINIHDMELKKVNNS